MFEFDAGKLIIIGIVALIVIGPKELPRVMRHVGEAMAKMRRMAAEFRAQFMDAMRESELDEIKSGMEQISQGAKTGGLDPLAQIRAELTQAIGESGNPAALPAAGAGTPSQSASAAPLAIEPNQPPQAATGAEMRALADALAAEIGEAAPGSAIAGRAAAPEKG
ncbi:MAG: Sec-independent protein translocase protein TatB [Beijerinckiaceae bacterium]|nr:Sec-independent protein translocase protein TatB [Beijerinckiaceae bacterium]